MKIGKWARLLLAAAPFLAGCGNFWQAPGSGSSSGSFSLSNGGGITASSGSSGTSLITVTPSNSFTGTVGLTCAVTSTLSSPTSPGCNLNPTSVSITSTTVETSTLTVTDTAGSTTPGAYTVTVTGVSGNVAESTTLCAVVGGSSSTCSNTSGTSGIFYVLNQGTNQIAGFSIVSGTVTKVSGSPYTLPAPPASIAIAPSGGYLYVGTTTGGIYLYTIGSGGALTLANNSLTISQDSASTMQVVSGATNSWLVEAGPNAATLWAIAVNTSTGTPVSSTEAEQSAPLGVSTINQLAISPDKSNVFVALGSTGTVVVPFDASSSGNPFGQVSNPIAPKGINAVSVAVDPSNRLFYIGEIAAGSGTSNTGGVRAFTYSALPTQTEITTTPYPSGGLAPYAILPSADGNFVYVANRTVTGSSTGNIAAFSFTTSGSNYSLTSLGSPVSAGAFPVGLAEDSNSSYVLVVNSGTASASGTPDLGAYTMSSGALTFSVGSATGTDPVQAIAIAAVP